MPFYSLGMTSFGHDLHQLRTHSQQWCIYPFTGLHMLSNLASLDVLLQNFPSSYKANSHICALSIFKCFNYFSLLIRNSFNTQQKITTTD